MNELAYLYSDFIHPALLALSQHIHIVRQFFDLGLQGALFLLRHLQEEM